MTPERLAEIRDSLKSAKSHWDYGEVIPELLAAYEAQVQKLSNSDATIEGLADELAAARASYTELDHRNDELAFYNAAAFRQAEELRGALAKAREALKAKSGLVLEANRKLEEWRAIAKERGERNDLNEAELRTLRVLLAEARGVLREALPIVELECDWDLVGKVWDAIGEEKKG